MWRTTENEQDLTGSMELIRCLKSSSRTGMKINLSEIQSSFAIILYNLIFMFRKGSESWTIAILEPNKELQIDIYYTHYQSKVYEFQAILVCNSFKTLKLLPDLKDLPSIPLTVQKLEFSILKPKNDDEDRVSIDSGETRFFNELLN